MTENFAKTFNESLQTKPIHRVLMIKTSDKLQSLVVTLEEAAAISTFLCDPNNQQLSNNCHVWVDTGKGNKCVGNKPENLGVEYQERLDQIKFYNGHLDNIDPVDRSCTSSQPLRWFAQNQANKLSIYLLLKDLHVVDDLASVKTLESMYGIQGSVDQKSKGSDVAPSSDAGQLRHLEPCDALGNKSYSGIFSNKHVLTPAESTAEVDSKDAQKDRSSSNKGKRT